MFAKIFGQIFDSSIAEDYNCRRMFMDLLVLADPEGGVDMTYEAISRRTNVPIDEVKRYIGELMQPDAASRSQVSNGQRIVPLDSGRDWGWQIVNYKFYRQIRDQEVRRAYFRDSQRKYRAKKKGVKDKVLTPVDKSGHVSRPVTSPSTSSSSSDWFEELKKDEAYQDVDVEREYHKAVRWCKEKRLTLSRMRFINWLNRADRNLVAGTNQNLSPKHRQNKINLLNEKKQELNRMIKDPQNPPSWIVEKLSRIDEDLKQL
jgi:hypothetical protein